MYVSIFIWVCIDIHIESIVCSNVPVSRDNIEAHNSVSYLHRYSCEYVVGVVASKIVFVDISSDDLKPRKRNWPIETWNDGITLIDYIFSWRYNYKLRDILNL